MYVTNEIQIAKIAEHVGVERIFVDMEYIGKAQRQGGMNTVQNHHTVEDVRRIRRAIIHSEVLVRINPIHEVSDRYSSSEDEINAVIDAGADIIMLPYFKTADEVRKFYAYVEECAKTVLLLETPEAVESIDEILKIPEVKEIHIGINDLALGYGKKFMFELLTDGTVEKLCEKFKEKGIAYGFGGIASLNQGLLKGRYVMKEHYRLGSTCTILSRSFCDLNKIEEHEAALEIFERGVREIREFEKECMVCSQEELEENKYTVQGLVAKICSQMK